MYHILSFLTSFQLICIKQRLLQCLENERSRWFLWTPVGVGLGIAFYFSLSQEPATWVGFGAVVILSALIVTSRKARVLYFLAIGFWVIALGFTCAQWRVRSLGTSMLSKPLGQRALIGEIASIELRPEGQRLTLINIKVHSDQDNSLKKVRIIVRGKLQPPSTLQIGHVIKLKAVLLPPSEPVLPGAYNFRRKAYFEGINAVGFATRKPVILKQSSQTEYLKRLTIKWKQFQHSLTENLRKGIGGHEGAIAAALITGDRSGITRGLQQSFANAGIAHILAISGLHLSIIAGLAFFMIRRLLSLVPWVALNYPIKKWAAAFSIFLTSAYLSLCWGSVPALRAFFMTTLIMGAIILNRNALSMRNVAIASLIILVIWPESLLSPSFQLSFAAVIALIAVYESSQIYFLKTSGQKSIVKRFLLYIASIVLTTSIASIATIPFSIAFFHRFSLQAISANLLAIPLTSLWIMPLALFSMILMPIKGETWAFILLNQGIHLLITIASYVSKWPGAVILVPELSSTSLIFITMGGLWICLWQQPWRWWGVISIASGLGVALFLKAPDIYISGDGTLIGIKNNQILWLNSLHTGRFTRTTWLEHQGLDHVESLRKTGNEYSLYLPHLKKTLYIGPQIYSGFFPQYIHLKLKPSQKQLAYLNTLHISKSEIQKQGAHAIWLSTKNKPFIRTVAQEIGQRPWSLKRQ